jgi:hypothetical protein
MTKGAVGCAGMMITSLLMGACSSRESESPSAASGTEPRPAASTTTPPEKRSSLVGGHPRSYIRRVRGVSQTKAFSPAQHLWGIKFIPFEVSDRGVLLVSYLGRPQGTFRGRAYEYSSDHTSLRLGNAAMRKDIFSAIGSFRFVSGAFECPPGPAIYSWRLLDHNITLRLNASQESCDVRRAILEGDWRFSD